VVVIRYDEVSMSDESDEALQMQGLAG